MGEGGTIERMYKRMNGQTDEQKSPCVLQDFVPFGAAAQAGGAAFHVIGKRLVLSSNADLVFTNGAEKMLKDKKS